jgi:ribonuclease BN (tRNA processing enzyme)
LSLDTKRLLFDIGPGTLRQLSKAAVSYLDLDYVFLSHLHVDHTADLAALLFANNHPERRRLQPLVLAGGNGLKRFLSHLSSAYPEMLEPRTYPLDVMEGTTESRSFGEFTISWRPTAHIASSVAFRVEWDGGSFVYLGDTEYCPSLVELARDAHTVVLECSVPEEDKIPGHLTALDVARIGQETRCKRLVMTHFYPYGHEEDAFQTCQRTFEGEVVVAVDLMRLDIPA